MANTTTSRYALVKPEVGAATDTWGALINTDLDDIDSQLLRKLDKTLVDAVSQTITIANTNSRVTTATTKGFQNVGVGDRIFISGSDTSGNNAIHTVTAIDTTNWLYVDCSGTTFVDDGPQTMTWGVVTKMKIDGSPGIDNTPIGATTASTGAFTTLSASGEIGSDLVPSADDAKDLGSSSKEWKDLYIDGTAYIDTASITSLTVAGGTGISSTPISGSTGSFTTLAVTSADTITMQNFTMGTNAKGDRTVSTSSPSGGSNGDVWYVVS